MKTNSDTFPKWGIGRMARHYADTLMSEPDENGIHQSKIFGPSKNIMLVATLSFGQDAVIEVFGAELRKRGYVLK